MKGTTQERQDLALDVSEKAERTGRFSVIPGFFIQDEGGDFGLLPRLGLIQEDERRWVSTLKKIERLNAEGGGRCYKLIIAGRHGQGVHNHAESFYGSKLWDEQMAKCDGGDGMVWGPDALLTDEGRDQARAVGIVWMQELKAGIPVPQHFYCSPLSRALETCVLTFKDVTSISQENSTIVENCREMYGDHSCDMRRTRTEIENAFPQFSFENGFTEKDLLHDPDVRESEEHLVERGRKVLEYIFEHTDGNVISITAHSGFIRGLTRSAGHSPVSLSVGGVLPMVIVKD